MQKTLGGDRLGSGQKNTVHLHNYERSTHNMSRTWRSTMSVGTLVPFFHELALNGDTFDIDLQAMVRTLPATGPLLGSFKLQLDVFECPIRLYNGILHNNALNIGMRMDAVKIPKIRISTIAGDNELLGKKQLDVSQINPSSLPAYFGIRGIGLKEGDTTTVERNFNAVPFIAYWDIFKNYYANKQENIAYCVQTDYKQRKGEGKVTRITTSENVAGRFMIQTTDINFLNQNWDLFGGKLYQNGNYYDKYYILYGDNIVGENITIDGRPLDDYGEWEQRKGSVKLTPYEDSIYNIPPDAVICAPSSVENYSISLRPFNIDIIDQLREDILRQTRLGYSYQLDTFRAMPYAALYGNTDSGKSLNIGAMNGLAIKTYQSDLFNNWIKTDWIDGPSGIAAVTAVDTSTGAFTIDALNLAKKVYNMLNRIATSGGTYEDWQEAVWGEDAIRRAETPIYCGGMSQEIVFDEVVSTVEQEGHPLGTLSGKGTLLKKDDGGHIVIHVKEPSFIIGIVSITPRIDYAQGNKWYMTERLDSMADLHAPALDGIGFENLMIEQMAWFDREFDAAGNLKPGRSAGKVPAWINYMTAVDEVYGNFCLEKELGFMVLNRKYEWDETQRKVKDVTTYIDPTHYNEVFAYSDIDSQNFWVQIGTKCIARRKMSAKIIPNL